MLMFRPCFCCSDQVETSLLKEKVDSSIKKRKSIDVIICDFPHSLYYRLDSHSFGKTNLYVRERLR